MASWGLSDDFGHNIYQRIYHLSEWKGLPILRGGRLPFINGHRALDAPDAFDIIIAGGDVDSEHYNVSEQKYTTQRRLGLTFRSS